MPHQPRRRCDLQIDQVGHHGIACFAPAHGQRHVRMFRGSASPADVLDITIDQMSRPKVCAKTFAIVLTVSIIDRPIPQVITVGQTRSVVWAVSA